jgi:hypothetical protein
MRNARHVSLLHPGSELTNRHTAHLPIPPCLSIPPPTHLAPAPQLPHHRPLLYKQADHHVLLIRLPYVPIPNYADEQGTYLTSYQFESCSYAASTTAQYISTSNSSITCFDECGDYPVTYIFPSAGGYNCYCAMTSNGAGKTDCGNNTFYAYSREVEPSRSRR